MSKRDSILKIQHAEVLIVVGLGAVRTIRTDLTDARWEVLAPILEKPAPDSQRGRPSRDPRGVLNAILWIVRTGLSWRYLPSRYPPYQTCHRRRILWQRDGTLTRLLEAAARDHRGRRKPRRSSRPAKAAMSSGEKWARLSAALIEDAVRKPASANSATIFLTPEIAPAFGVDTAA